MAVRKYSGDEMLGALRAYHGAISGSSGYTPSHQIENVRRAAPRKRSGGGGGINIPGGLKNLLGKAFYAVDTPRSFVFSAGKELADAMGGNDASWSDLGSQTFDAKKRMYGSDVLADKIDNKWVRSIAGLGLDIAADPLTYILPGAAAVGGKGAKAAAMEATRLAEQAGARAVEEATARGVGEAAAREAGHEAAKATLEGSRDVVARAARGKAKVSELRELGVENARGGPRVRVPFPVRGAAKLAGKELPREVNIADSSLRLPVMFDEGTPVGRAGRAAKLKLGDVVKGKDTPSKLYELFGGKGAAEKVAARSGGAKTLEKAIAPLEERLTSQTIARTATATKAEFNDILKSVPAAEHETLFRALEGDTRALGELSDPEVAARARDWFTKRGEEGGAQLTGDYVPRQLTKEAEKILDTHVSKDFWKKGRRITGEGEPQKAFGQVIDGATNAERRDQMNEAFRTWANANPDQLARLGKRDQQEIFNLFETDLSKVAGNYAERTAHSKGMRDLSERLYAQGLSEDVYTNVERVTKAGKKQGKALKGELKNVEQQLKMLGQVRNEAIAGESTSVRDLLKQHRDRLAVRAEQLDGVPAGPARVLRQAEVEADAARVELAAALRESKLRGANRVKNAAELDTRIAQLRQHAEVADQAVMELRSETHAAENAADIADSVAKREAKRAGVVGEGVPSVLDHERIDQLDVRIADLRDQARAGQVDSQSARTRIAEMEQERARLTDLEPEELSQDLVGRRVAEAEQRLADVQPTLAAADDTTRNAYDEAFAAHAEKVQNLRDLSNNVDQYIADIEDDLHVQKGVLDKKDPARRMRTLGDTAHVGGLPEWAPEVGAERQFGRVDQIAAENADLLGNTRAEQERALVVASNTKQTLADDLNKLYQRLHKAARKGNITLDARQVAADDKRLIGLLPDELRDRGESLGFIPGGELGRGGVKEVQASLDRINERYGTDLRLVEGKVGKRPPKARLRDVNGYRIEGWESLHDAQLAGDEALATQKLAARGDPGQVPFITGDNQEKVINLPPTREQYHAQQAVRGDAGIVEPTAAGTRKPDYTAGGTPEKVVGEDIEQRVRDRMRSIIHVAGYNTQDPAVMEQFAKVLDSTEGGRAMRKRLYGEAKQVLHDTAVAHSDKIDEATRQLDDQLAQAGDKAAHVRRSKQYGEDIKLATDQGATVSEAIQFAQQRRLDAHQARQTLDNAVERQTQLGEQIDQVTGRRSRLGQKPGPRETPREARAKATYVQAAGQHQEAQRMFQQSAADRAAEVQTLQSQVDDLDTALQDPDLRLGPRERNEAEQHLDALQRSVAWGSAQPEVVDEASATLAKAITYQRAAANTEAQMAGWSWKGAGLRDQLGSLPTETIQVDLRDHVKKAAFTELSNGIATPNEIADLIKRVDRGSTAAEMTKLLKTYDSVVGYIKNWQLLKPGFHERNLLGGLWNNRAADIDNLSYGRWGRMWRDLSKGRLGAGSVEEQFAQHALDASGAAQYGTEFARAAELTAEHGMTANPLSPRFFAFKGTKYAGEHVEGFLRGSLVYDTFERGGMRQALEAGDQATVNALKRQAADRVATYHFDYSDLSHFEKNTVKRIMPFYTWTRKNIPLQMELLAKRPGMFSTYAQFQHEFETLSPEDAIAPPDYFAENLGIRTPFKTGGGQMYAFPGLPPTDLARVGQNPVDMARDVLGMATPAIKTPLELTMGRKVFKNLPFKEDYVAPSWVTALPGLPQALEKVGWAKKKDGRWLVPEQFVYTAEQELPVLGNLRRQVPNNKRDQDKALASWLSYLGPLVVRTNTTDEQTNTQKQRDYEAAHRGR